MQSSQLKTAVNRAVLALTILLFAAGASFAQSTVNLTATSQTTTLPDGNKVAMWGWLCGTDVGTTPTAGGTGTAAAVGATCTTMNGSLQTLGTPATTTTPPTPATLGAIWQPPLIVLPYVGAGTSLTINLTNNLPMETSLTIVGQLGGSLGQPVREPGGPRADGAHAGQTTTTWTIQGGGSFTPPGQSTRARSFVPEAAAPTTSTTGTVTPGKQTYIWTSLKQGTYLIETGTYPSIQGPMGLYAVLVVTAAPTTVGTFAPGTAYSGTALTAAPSTNMPYSIQYDADVPLLLSEIDPVQNQAVVTAVATKGFNETTKWLGTPGACGDPTVHTCLPPAVNYTPLYFLMNGLAFDRTAVSSSAVGVGSLASTGNVLLRFVNAGLRMHVPTVDGLNMSLIAEDGNVLSDIALQAAKGGATSFKYDARTQNEVFLAAGKVYDVVVKPANNGSTTVAATAYNPGQFAVFDRQLSLSGNGFHHDTGMLAIVPVAGGVVPCTPVPPATTCTPVISGAVLPQAVADNYVVPFGATTFSGNVLNNDIGIFSAAVSGSAPTGLTFNANGSFTFAPGGAISGTTFNYCGNGTTSGTAGALCAPVNLTVAAQGPAPVAHDDAFGSSVATLIKVNAPGVLANDIDPTGYPLKVVTTLDSVGAGLSVTMNPDGGFTAAQLAAGGGVYTFSYHVTNSQGTPSTPANVTLTFRAGSGVMVHVFDAPSVAAGAPVEITDYKWIIEQDLTFRVDPACQQNGPGGTKPTTCPTGVPPTLGTNLHTSYMPVIASGCTGSQSCEQSQTVYDNNPSSATYRQHVPAVCDGSGICHSASSSVLPTSTPDKVNLPTVDQFGRPAYYYISILPGDVSNPFNTGNFGDPTVAGNCAPTTGQTTPNGTPVTSTCGHTMGGTSIAPTACTASSTGTTFTSCTLPASVSVNVEPSPLPTATLTVFVFEDDFPLNGEPDTGGGVDTFPTQEVPLGDFQVILWDDAGGSGDATGQLHHDMFNMPLTNSLNGTIDPGTGLNACPIANTAAADPTNNAPSVAIGTIIVCPQFEADGVTPSPLTGQAVIRNLMPGRFGVIVHPGQTREAAGEEWLQTNTLDGTHFQDAFIKAGEPAYFQEFGPGGYHVFAGMANPAIINARLAGMCNATGGTPAVTPLKCNNTVQGQVTNLHQSRAPNETLYDSGVGPQGDPRNYAAINYTNCYVSLGDPDGETIALTKCDPNGNFKFTGIPDGNWGIVVFDQWLDLIVDGSSKPVNVAGGQTKNVDYSAFTWQAHLETKIFYDVNGNGIQDDPATEPGLLQVASRIRMRNGKFNNFSPTDITGGATFNETFPLFNWYVVESDTVRFKNTGVHVVNDAGGRVDGPSTGCFGATVSGSTGTCGNGNGGPYQGILNSNEIFSLPTDLRIPGAYYCSAGDCSERLNVAGTPPVGGPGGSTGRIDPGSTLSEGWQGGLGEFDFIEWGKQAYEAGENGGIRGHVVYSSTRPFDDVSQQFQNLWDPLVPGVTVNLYQESAAADGTQSLTLVDTTTTSSWDAWAQGFRTNASGTILTSTAGGGAIPNMNCPGQDARALPTGTDPFFSYTLAGTPFYLDPTQPIAYNSAYKCYDGYHNLNQMQPAPYDGMYEFPSAACLTPGATLTATINGAPQTITCATKVNTHAGDPGSSPVVLPPGKYVAEVVVPNGYELVKEEDKNILIGDQFIAPATQQFAGLGSIFIVPDQATLNNTNPCYGSGGGCTNPTTDMGHPLPSTFGPGGLITSSAPCVGALRIVPDFMSISPESGEVAPFAGASRNLCDRKELTLEDQMQAQTDFFIWTKTPAASHYTGFITDDFASEFDPASPGFGEKFAVPNVPVAIRDFNGVETSRVYSDQWGTFNGMVYSTFDVDPPNPTGYAPNMMVTCMNDPGPIPAGPGGALINDPLYNPNYGTFCYENPFMPQDSAYLDTPVVPTSAFAEGYNPPDCQYPDGTPAISRVDGNTLNGGPYIDSSQTMTLTITALGNQTILNPAYSGPAASTAPFNLKFITRHYGFGSAAGTVALRHTNSNGTIVTIPLTVASGGWTDGVIHATVPASITGSNSDMICASPSTTPRLPWTSRCGELVITTAPSPFYPRGQSSIDTVTVTIEDSRLARAPHYVTAENGSNSALQDVIDSATTLPGDMIIVGPPVGITVPATFTEMLLMWKPLRLQGVGAASAVVNASAHPAGKLLQPWRRKVNCLFGLALNGGFVNNTPNPNNGGLPANPFDPSGAFSCNNYSAPVTGLLTTQSQVDPIMLEPVVGWDATLNGNIAELLQEPTLMGAYEGAAITVLGKGLENNNTTNCDPLNSGGCVALNSRTGSGGDCNLSSPFYTSNFLCNPSRIDGLTFTNSSQGGGGIFLHGWNHYTEVSNNRVHSNGGTLTGGITVGQMETPDPTLVGTVAQALNIDNYVYLHNNSITQNTAYGDELNSTTPSSAGGVTFCTGSDNYRFQYNWVCGNLSTGDGGGMSHNGLSFNGDIEFNSFLFNQSTNPTLTTYGGGLIVQGAGPDGTACENASVDMDCPPTLSDGIGQGLVINANLFQGNTAESGSGGGMRLQSVNGNDILNNPLNSEKGNWYRVRITNNVIVNNVAGWTGGGVSMEDAVLVDFINNTVVSNDTTASAGVLFDTLGAANSNVPPPGCEPVTGVGCTNPIVSSTNQPSGLVTEKHSLNLQSALNGVTASCVINGVNRPNCKLFSNPLLENNIIYQNRTFHIQPGTAQGTQNVITLVPTLSQSVTGACPTTGFGTPPGPGPSYWDIGVYGDASPTPNSGSGFALNPTFSIMTSISGYNGAGLRTGNPAVVSQYCNGSRVPPETASQTCTSTANAPGCGTGTTVNPGIPDINPFYPVYNLSPAATVDEGNNWINMLFGPLTLSNEALYTAAGTVLAPLGNYSITAASTEPLNHGTSSNNPPSTDFFGTHRPQGGAFDIGAVEVVVQVVTPVVTLTPTSHDFGPVVLPLTTATAPTFNFTLSNTGAAGGTFNIGSITVGASPFSRINSGGFPAGAPNCGATLAAGANCTIKVRFFPTGPGVYNGSVTVNGTDLGGTAVAVTNSPAGLTGTGLQGAVTFTLQPGAPAGVSLGFLFGAPFLNFGTQTAGSTTNATLVLTNSGNAPITYAADTVTNLFGGGPRYAKGADTCTGTTLAVAGSCTVTVSFTPNNGAFRFGALTVNDNGAGSPQIVSLLGN